MAAVEVTSSVSKESSLKGKRMSTRVDMTPMVDLGFLLITFFMLATTMSKPTAMSVFFPAKSDDGSGTPIKASGVLTIFLGARDEIYYLDGIAAGDERAEASLKTTKPGFDLRNVIFHAQKRVRSRAGNEDREDNELIVVIKPTAVSSYKNMVDAMDEMAITKSRRYALVDELTAEEEKVLGERILVK